MIERPSSQQPPWFLRLIGTRALGGSSAETKQPERHENLKVRSTLVKDGDTTKRLQTIPGQPGYMDLGDMLPQEPGDEALLVYRDDNYSGEVYFVRFEGTDKDDGAELLVYRLSVQNVDTANAVEVVGLGDISLGGNPAWGQMSLSPLERDGQRQRLDRLYVLRGHDGDTDSPNLDTEPQQLPDWFRICRYMVEQARQSDAD